MGSNQYQKSRPTKYIFQVMSGSVSFDNISRLMRTSESFSDLNAELNPGSCNKSRGASTNGSVAGVGGPPAPPSANSAKANQEDSATNKPFGLGKRIFSPF